MNNDTDGESENDDCGIDGEDSAPVTHREFNRTIRRMHVGHYRPMRNKINSIVAWIAKADETAHQFEGAFKALKAIGYIIVASIIATFTTTVWLISKLMP